jgi:hypothetical protein
MGFPKLKLTMTAGIMALMLPFAAQAQWWQHHPHYLHAMSDLRSAYWLISHHDPMDPAQSGEEMRAMKQIRYAYQALKDASIMDDKDIDAQPPADMAFYDHRGRLHKALDLLRDSRNDVRGEEDDPAARGLRHDAGKRIDDAIRATEDAIHSWSF